MTLPFFTIGHSTRSIAELVDLLRASQVELVVDVRHIPRSRTNPQFNRETFPDELRSFQSIAVPMIGGMVSSTVLTLVVIPAIYAVVKGFRLPSPQLHAAGSRVLQTQP
jgi:Protein of unknown function, DUF488